MRVPLSDPCRSSRRVLSVAAYFPRVPVDRALRMTEISSVSFQRADHRTCAPPAARFPQRVDRFATCDRSREISEPRRIARTMSSVRVRSLIVSSNELSKVESKVARATRWRIKVFGPLAASSIAPPPPFKSESLDIEMREGDYSSSDPSS